jgi:hypothetical protein
MDSEGRMTPKDKDALEVIRFASKLEELAVGVDNSLIINGGLLLISTALQQLYGDETGYAFHREAGAIIQRIEAEAEDESGEPLN